MTSKEQQEQLALLLKSEIMCFCRELKVGGELYAEYLEFLHEQASKGDKQAKQELIALQSSD